MGYLGRRRPVPRTQGQKERSGPLRCSMTGTAGTKWSINRFHNKASRNNAASSDVPGQEQQEQGVLINHGRGGGGQSLWVGWVQKEGGGLVYIPVGSHEGVPALGLRSQAGAHQLGQTDGLDCKVNVPPGIHEGRHTVINAHLERHGEVSSSSSPYSPVSGVISVRWTSGQTRSVRVKPGLYGRNPVCLGQTRSAQAKLSLYGLNYIVPVPTKKQHMMTVQSGSTIANGRKITLSELLWPSSVKRIVQLQNRKKNHVNHMYCTCVHTIMRICMHVCACMSA